MKLKVNLAWKIVVGAPENGVDYCSANKHFNVKTGKTFINKLGGVSSLDFYPCTFDPTNVFYNAIEPCKLENGFVGKRMPFEGLVEGANGVKKPIKIKIHQYSSDLVILSVSVNQIDFDGDVNDLQEVMSIETHNELFNLVRVICSIISSGGIESNPVQRKLKAYPYIELESSNGSHFVDDKTAVELLTRHKNPKSDIVQSVILKNHDHQLDDNSILIDRQGILARYFSDLSENQSIQRKFESSHYLFELAISLSHIMENNGYSALTAEQRNSITKLIKNPTVVFTKSVTAYKTWQLLLDEFKLNELYDFIVTSNEMEEEPQKVPEASPTSENKDWSELKKWTMGILSVLMVSLLLSAARTFYQEFNPFPNEIVSLLHPSDDVQFDRKSEKINFNWGNIENAKKYILFVEKYNSKNNKWLPPDSGGRFVVSRTSIPIAINEDGHFKWKVVARNSDEEKISESVWYFFKINTLTTPNKKMQPTQKTRG